MVTVGGRRKWNHQEHEGHEEGTRKRVFFVFFVPLVVPLIVNVIAP